ncbi:MAG: ParB/RepB/Spo0J family partition protein [Burkholderiaceae bacterium]
MKKPKGLGQGLDALLGDENGPATTGSLPERSDEPPRDQVIDLALDAVRQGKYQPRVVFDDDALESLTDSVRQHGIMQPILVRALERPEPGSASRYEIVAGERRYRAAERAGLASVPAIVVDLDDRQTLSMALIENIQREDLNPIEEALAIRRLIEEFAYTHETAAAAIGRSRSATTNLLRLLNLPDSVQRTLASGLIDMGHGRALLALDPADQAMLGRQIIEERLSVRETESRVAQWLANRGQSAPAESDGRKSLGARQAPDPDVQRLQNRLSDLLAAPVALRTNTRGGGRLSIRFSNAEQFEGLIERMGLQSLLAGDD